MPTSERQILHKTIAGSGISGIISSGSGISRQRLCTKGAPSGQHNGLQSRVEFDFALKFIPEISPEISRPAEAQGTWWIAKVRFRHEVRVAQTYADAGIAWCVPQTVETKRYANRTKRVVLHKPLLARAFVPCCVPPDGDVSKLYVRDGVQKIYRVADQGRFVRQLDRMYTANKIQPLDPYPYTAVGKLCKVLWGPFEGTVGIVIERKEGGSIVVLQVGTLGDAALPMSFEPDELEPAEPVD